MSSRTIVKEGVVAEYEGKYWGEEYSDHSCTCMNFIDGIENAKISESYCCSVPTDMTWTPQYGRCNPDYDKLSKARLLKVKITTTFEVQDGPSI